MRNSCHLQAVASYFVFGEATQDALWLTGKEPVQAFCALLSLQLFLLGAFLIVLGTTLILNDGSRSSEEMKHK